MSAPARHTAVRQSQLGAMGRISLLIAWTAFWLGTALFPCCEAIAAALADHPGTVAHQSAEASPHTEMPGEAHHDHPDGSPGTLCHSPQGGGSAVVGESATASLDRLVNDVPAMAARVWPASADGRQTTQASIPRPALPPPLGLHQRTRRLLI